MRGIGLLLFVVYMPYLFSMEFMSQQIGLQGSVFAPTQTVLMAILKWITYMCIGTCMIAPFFNLKTLREFTALITPIVLILNGIFFKQVTIYSTGAVSYYDYRCIFYALSLCLSACVAGEALYQKIRTKDFAHFGKSVLFALAFLGIWFMAFMPLHFPQLMVGHIGQKTKDFNVTHRILMYICVAFKIGRAHV